MRRPYGVAVGRATGLRVGRGVRDGLGFDLGVGVGVFRFGLGVAVLRPGLGVADPGLAPAPFTTMLTA